MAEQKTVADGAPSRVLAPLTVTQPVQQQPSLKESAGHPANPTSRDGHPSPGITPPPQTPAPSALPNELAGYEIPVQAPEPVIAEGRTTLGALGNMFGVHLKRNKPILEVNEADGGWHPGDVTRRFPPKVLSKPALAARVLNKMQMKA